MVCGQGGMPGLGEPGDAAGGTVIGYDSTVLAGLREPGGGMSLIRDRTSQTSASVYAYLAIIVLTWAANWPLMKLALGQMPPFCLCCCGWPAASR